MSVEEEVELRDLVAQTLESNGSLAKIRAQLRASIFLALDEDELISSKQPLMNAKIKSQLETPEGQTMFCVVREFLQFFNLYFTLSVYDAESYFENAYQFEGRQKLIEDLGIDNVDDNFPILLHFVRNAQKNNNNKRAQQVNVSMNGSQSDRSVGEENESLKSANTSKSDHSDDQSSFDQNVPDKYNNNATFNVSDPSVNGLAKIENNSNEKLNNQKDINLNFTYKDDMNSSSIADNNSVLASDNNDISINGLNEKCNDSKPKSSPPKSDKLKTKISLISDLPPIQMNKPRTGNDILPSLYSKEFKDKSNLRELDKLFDMQGEYEEDFMYSGDELSLKSDYSRAESLKVNLMDNVTSGSVSERSISKPSKSPNSNNSGKSLYKTNIGNQKTKENSLEKRRDSDSISSISEMLDVTTSD